jgi:uncharacterized protein
MMHPDNLPLRSAGQRALALLLRVVHFPLLRLVWTLLLFFAVYGLLGRVAPSVARLTNLSLGGSLRNALLATGVLWASVHLLEGKSLGEAVGLSWARAAGFFRGFLLGAALLTLTVGLLALAGDYHVDGLGAGATVRAVGSAAVLLFFAAVFEEVIARGIFFRLLEQGLGTWAALAVSAGLFGLGHRGNPGATALSAVALALEAGVLLGAAYAATRSLWLPIGLHTAWNLFEGPVYGAAVSGNALPSVLSARFVGPAWLTGGAFGPEAGLAALVLGCALGGAFLLLALRRGQVFTPRWLRRLLGGTPRLPAVTPRPPVAPEPRAEPPLAGHTS